jgi:hypothetical protein
MGKIKPPKGKQGSNIKLTVDSKPRLNFNYPIFCLKHLHPKYNLDKCEVDEKAKLIERMHKLSSITWEIIRTSHRHGMGAEKIERTSIKTSIPSHITPDTTLYALRFDGLKPFVGYRSEFIFHIVYIDRDFTLYNH